MKKLALLWRSFQNEHWYQVGTLSFLENGEYSFSYTINKKILGVNDALKVGFRRHPTFPDLQKTYYAKRLFSSFSRRLPNIKRSDIIEKYRQQKRVDLTTVDLGNPNDLYELFQLNGGQLVADHYLLVKPIEKIALNHYQIEFYVQGLEFFAENWQEDGQFQHIKLEPENKSNSPAIMVNDRDLQIGYVPAFFAPSLPDYLDQIKFEQAQMEKNGKFRLRLTFSLVVDSTELEKRVPEIVEQ